MALYEIHANLVDIHLRETYPARVVVRDGLIEKIERIDRADHFLLPGFIDAHVHIESSMMVPSEFARMAVRHGSVATVSDPHEIANVLGEPGVDFMIQNGAQSPFKFYFGAPSCVPATTFETAGASLGAEAVAQLLARKEIKYLAEMMNWPGVLQHDAEVLAKIDAAKNAQKPIDGHAPGLKGDQAHQYASAGISTDHECVALDEAVDKVDAGMKIIIREGSAAKNFEALHPLIGMNPDRVMFCSDDKHPDALEIGHINALVKRSVDLGYNLYDVLRMASLHPVEHYGLEVGLLREGDPADFIIIDSFEAWHVLETYIDGACVFSEDETRIPSVPIHAPNQFNIERIETKDLTVAAQSGKLRVIVAKDGSLLTESKTVTPLIQGGKVISDTANDVLKMVVVNRYQQTKPAVAFVKNFGLKKGAIASSVGHDSHNITAVGVDDDSIAAAVNAIIDHRGGVSVAGETVDVLPLPVAGLMTALDGVETATRYKSIDTKAKKLGTPLAAPFMTLSFMSLLVIPDLKLSDKGLFSGRSFEFQHLFC